MVELVVRVYAQKENVECVKLFVDAKNDFIRLVGDFQNWAFAEM